MSDKMEDEFKSTRVTLSAKGTSFYRNQEEMTIGDDKTKTKFTRANFEDAIQNEVEQFVNSSFKHIVLLVGAGASVVLDGKNINPKYGKTVAMIADVVERELSKGKYNLPRPHKKDAERWVKERRTVFGLEEMARTIGYGEVVKSADGLTVKANTEVRNFNLEDFLSRLITYVQFVQGDAAEEWKDSLAAIYDIIENQTSYSYDETVFNHSGVINVLSKKLSSETKLCVVTTNYDTLLEEAAQADNHVVFDGFTFTIHPEFDDDMFEWHLSKHVSNVTTRENIYKPQVIDLLKIHGSLTWREQDGKVVRVSRSTPGQPVMIFPSSSKYMQSYQEPYFELFSRFQEILKQPSTLLITAGFSFADNHIARMIMQAITHNPGLSILVTDYTIEPEEPNQNWKDLVNAQEHTHPIAFLKATMNGNLLKYFGGLR